MEMAVAAQLFLTGPNLVILCFCSCHKRKQMHGRYDLCMSDRQSSASGPICGVIAIENEVLNEHNYCGVHTVEMRYLEGVVLRAGGDRDPDVVDEQGSERSAVAALQLRVIGRQLHIRRGTALQTGHNTWHHKLAQGHCSPAFSLCSVSSTHKLRDYRQVQLAYTVELGMPTEQEVSSRCL